MQTRHFGVSPEDEGGTSGSSTLADKSRESSSLAPSTPCTVSEKPKRRTGATAAPTMSVLDVRPLNKPVGNNMFGEFRFPAQTHDTTSIYIAAQRQQRLHKEPTRRSSTNVPPNKSCLSPPSKSEPSSPSKVKRKVSFADDKGLSLTEVRVMKNEINELPQWTREILLQSLPLARKESTIIQMWDPLFPQPASDYLAFRKKIEENHVALENVIVRKDDDLLTGTVKVKNVSFEKRVFVRATFDCWTSYCDYPAIFVPQGLATLPALFDTFSFSIKVPGTAARYGMIEMCVGYQTATGESWDSNNGKNYKLALITKRSPEIGSPMAPPAGGPVYPARLSSFGNSDISGWMDFGSWNQILTQGPYW